MRTTLTFTERLAVTACLLGLAFGTACGSDDERAAVAAEPTGRRAEPVATPVIVGPVSFEDAEASYRGGRYEEAVAKFTAYTETKPDNAWGFYMLGLSAWKSGDHRLAEQALLGAIERDSTHVKSRLNLSRVLMETNRHAEALEHVQTAIDLAPTSSEGHRLLGRVYDGLGRRDDAVWAYKQAIVLNGRDVWALNNLGTVLIREGRHAEAVGPLARAVELESGVATFQNNLGAVLERVGRFALAAEAYRAALALDSTYGKAAVSLARVEQLTEDPTIVPIDLEEAVRRFLNEVERWRDESAEREG